MENKYNQIYTVGYATENNLITINEFMDCLDFYGIKSLIDIRANPMPTDYPEFDRGHLHQYCENKNIIYHWAGRQLGMGIEIEKESQHDAIINKYFRSYADYMQTHEFQVAAVQIINMAKTGRLALFSKSIQPENDFRTLLSDYLLLQGLPISHIISTGHERDHLLHKNARRESIELIYDKID